MFNIFKQNVYIFNISAYVTNIKPLNIQKMCKMIGYIMPHGQKSDVLNIIFGIAQHLYIT